MEHWIAEVVGLMHIHKITQMDLAKHIGVTNDYISLILRGKKSPKNIEKRLKIAVDEIIKQKNANS